MTAPKLTPERSAMCTHDWSATTDDGFPICAKCGANKNPPITVARTPMEIAELRAFIEASNVVSITPEIVCGIIDAYEALQAERDRLAKRGSDADEEVQRLLHVLDERTNERDRYRATLEAADDLTKTLYPPLEAICCGAKDPVGVAQGALTMLDDEFRKEIGR
jgi:hypothetical protein